jgi:predicted alpha/beta hydrolase family esterase
MMKWFSGWGHQPLQDEAVTVNMQPAVGYVKAPSVVLIHGANASTLSYAYLRSQLPEFNYINIDYNAEAGFESNLPKMVQILQHAGPVYLIGHSLGGIYAIHVAQYINAIGGATVSTPHAGSETAKWASLAVPYKIFKDVSPNSRLITRAKDYILPNKKWINFVSTVGNNPILGAKNDGVLTISSMSSRRDMETFNIAANHFEILHHDAVVRKIKSAVQNIEG